VLHLRGQGRRGAAPVGASDRGVHDERLRSWRACSSDGRAEGHPFVVEHGHGGSVGRDIREQREAARGVPPHPARQCEPSEVEDKAVQGGGLCEPRERQVGQLCGVEVDGGVWPSDSGVEAQPCAGLYRQAAVGEGQRDSPRAWLEAHQELERPEEVVGECGGASAVVRCRPRRAGGSSEVLEEAQDRPAGAQGQPVVRRRHEAEPVLQGRERQGQDHAGV